MTPTPATEPSLRVYRAGKAYGQVGTGGTLFFVALLLMILFTQTTGPGPTPPMMTVTATLFFGGIITLFSSQIVFAVRHRLVLDSRQFDPLAASEPRRLAATA